jgi:hypothetical protein
MTLTMEKRFGVRTVYKGDVGASPIVAGNMAIAIAPDLHNAAVRMTEKAM